MKMTPQQIALEAAEAYTRQEYPGLCTGLSDDTADFLEIRDQLAALILTAAAKMVRESGVEDALETARETDLPLKHLRIVDAALAKLRAITERKP